ncbi:MAG: ATP-binding cassette domain-containing protein [Bacilli bacterium]|jgi:ABC-type lipoprotein export system ATPase subunit|nr:ATP-binding cassette domain-containing protein [Bacilli bacterium]
MKLSFNRVEKYYQSQGKSIKGLDGVSFSLNDNDRFVVVTGESGSGKSTLGKILAGLLDIDEGKFIFEGIDVNSLDSNGKEDFFASRVSYVSQDESLIESLSARSNIAIALFRKGLSKKEANKQAKAALSEVGLNPESKIKVSFLSGGERQRVAIARALATKAPLIVFDEPTGNLDKAAAEKVNSLIGSLSEKRLIFYITHDYEGALPYATRHLILQDGEIIKDEIINTRKEDQQILEEEKNPSKQSRLKACLSASSTLLFSSGKASFLTIIGAFLMIIIILGSALGFTSFLASSTDDGKKVISDGYFDKTNQTHDAFGNKVSLKKVSIDSALPQLNDDSFVDYSSLLDKTNLHLFLDDEVSAINNNTNIDGFSYSGIQFQVAPYIPFKTKEEKTASVPENEEKASLLIKNIPAENPIYLSLSTMVGQKFFLTFFDALNTSTLDSKTNSDTALLENAPEVTINSFATTDNPYLEDGTVYLSASSKTMRILEEQIKDIHIGIKYPDLTWISLNSINSQEVDVSIDCEGSTIKHSENFIFDKSKPDKIQLPSK